MKIQNQNQIQVDPAAIQQQKKQADAVKAVPEKMPEERVTLSSKAVNSKQIEADLEKVPDVRMEMVNRIRSEVESGTYQRPADQVAEAMLTSSLIESAYR